MAITIETLVTRIEVDIKDFKVGMREAGKVADTETKNMKSAFARVSGGVGGAMEAIFSLKGAILGLATGAVAQFIGSTISAADELGRMSDVTGVSTKGIQELKFAASQLNVEQATLTQSLTLFNRSVGEAATGNVSLANTFSALGVSIRDSGGNLKSTEALFREVSNAITRVGSTAEQAAVAQQLFGRSGTQLLPMLTQGTKGLDEFAAKAQSLGLVLDKELIDRADETNDKLAVMKQVLTSQLSKAILEIAPQIQRTAVALTDMAVGLAGAVTWSAKLADAWARLIGNDPSLLIANLKTQLGIYQERLHQIEKTGPSTFQSIAAAMGDNASSAEGLRQKISEVELKLQTLQGAQRGLNASVVEGAGAQSKLNLALLERNRIQEEAQKLAGEKSTNKGEQLAKEIGLLRAAEDMKLQVKGDTHSAIMEREAELGTFYEDQNAAEVERMMAQNQLMTSIDAEQYAADIAANQGSIDSMMNQETLGRDNLLKLRDKANKQALQADSAKYGYYMGNAKSFFGDMMTLSKGSSKELFAVSKGFALATAIVDGVVATQKAFANPPGPPFSIPQTLATAAKAAVNVSTIAGTGFATGADMIPGVGIGDTVPAMLMPGERVVKTDTNKVLEQFLKDWRDGGGPGGTGGRIEVVLTMTDNLAEFIEAKIIERQRLGISLMS